MASSGWSHSTFGEELKSVGPRPSSRGFFSISLCACKHKIRGEKVPNGNRVPEYDDSTVLLPAISLVISRSTAKHHQQQHTERMDLVGLEHSIGPNWFYLTFWGAIDEKAIGDELANGSASLLLSDTAGVFCTAACSRDEAETKSENSIGGSCLEDGIACASA